MHPYVIDRMVQERRAELQRLARAGRAARPARTSWFGKWRERTGPGAPVAASREVVPACCPG